jgi:L-malate glycosyltransferase
MIESQKKIIIAASYSIFDERIGGMDYFFWELNKQLKTKNYQVSWLFQGAGNASHYSNKNIDYQVVEKGKDFTNELLIWLKVNKNPCLFLGIFLDYQSTVSEKIKTELNIPCLYVDQMSRSMKRKSWTYNLKRILKGIIYYKKIDGIIAISQFVKKTILSEIGLFWNSKIQVIYNALPLDNFVIESKIPEKVDKISIFCIGHLIKEKGFQVLIDACKKLELSKIPFSLTIAGDGVFKNNLEILAKNNLPEGSFQFLGNITNQPYYLNQSDLVIIPSLWKEAFGYTVVEAMLMKKVIFASNIGGIPEILDNNNLLFEAGNDQELFLLIKDYYANKQKYLPFADKLYQRARNNFSLDKMVKQYIDYIEKFI